jgi:hypothetical protein
VLFRTLAGYFELNNVLPSMRGTSKAFLLTLLLCAGGVASAQTFTGSWAHRGPNESGLWLDTAQNKNTLKFQLEVSRGAPSYNTGWIQGEVELKNNVGHFQQTIDGEFCEIRFRFDGNRVALRQDGDSSGCGFGHNVFAIGVLKRTSYQQPKFCSGDPRAGGCE